MTSVGQLMTMTAEQRARVIAQCGRVTRQRLAHLAALGSRQKAARAAQFIEDATLSAQIAAELTREDEETR